MVTNEWGKLRKVIVGVADYANIPPLDISYRTVSAADKLHESEIIHSVNYPKQVIEEANQDLEILCALLELEGVKVLRSNRESTNFFNYCPRDSVLTYGNSSFATPMPVKARVNEYKAFAHHLSNLTVCPRYNKDDLYNINCIGNKDILALTDIAPVFDAANIIKANDYLLYLVSNSGNEAGARYLQELLGDEVTVCVLRDAYSYSHIDSTIAFLREGLLLANPSRIKDRDMLPYPFNTWDIIWCPEPEYIDYYKPFNNASIWQNMNLFSISEDLVVIEEKQHNLAVELKKYHIESAMLPIRHCRTLAGAFHCVTLDIERD
jgi:scyllo-inosamine-4-phosphate amidinotransferase 1